VNYELMIANYSDYSLVKLLRGMMSLWLSAWIYFMFINSLKKHNPC